ncbi:Na+/proline symporter [Bradyrhizobium sp. GM5.1]
MLHDWGVIAAAFGYIGFLFLVASHGDRRSPAGRGRASGLIYPLSLAIYCTSWTFFGSVGFATRTSTDFLAIYVGPILMIGLGAGVLRRVIQLAKAHNITSIADFIGARYGKSQAVAATVALIAIIGSVPYIALQLKAVASSLETILSEDQAFSHIPIIGDVALIVTLAMAAFAVLFGTRQTDATEHQHGLMLAVATESIIKLVAFLAAGTFVTFWMFSPHELIERAMKTPEAVRVINYSPSIGNFPDHDAAVAVRDHAAAAPVPRQRGGEFLGRRGRSRALAVSALSRRHQSVRDPDRARRPRQLPVRRRRS